MPTSGSVNTHIATTFWGLVLGFLSLLGCSRNESNREMDLIRVRGHVGERIVAGESFSVHGDGMPAGEEGVFRFSGIVRRPGKEAEVRTFSWPMLARTTQLAVVTPSSRFLLRELGNAELEGQMKLIFENAEGKRLTGSAPVRVLVWAHRENSRGEPLLPWLGVSLEENEQASAFRILAVETNSRGAQVGLEPGSELRQLSGTPLQSLSDLVVPESSAAGELIYSKNGLNYRAHLNIERSPRWFLPITSLLFAVGFAWSNRSSAPRHRSFGKDQSERAIPTATALVCIAACIALQWFVREQVDRSDTFPRWLVMSGGLLPCLWCALFAVHLLRLARVLTRIDQPSQYLRGLAEFATLALAFAGLSWFSFLRTHSQMNAFPANVLSAAQLSIDDGFALSRSTAPAFLLAFFWAATQVTRTLQDRAPQSPKQTHRFFLFSVAAALATSGLEPLVAVAALLGFFVVWSVGRPLQPLFTIVLLIAAPIFVAIEQLGVGAVVGLNLVGQFAQDNESMSLLRLTAWVFVSFAILEHCVGSGQPQDEASESELLAL